MVQAFDLAVRLGRKEVLAGVNFTARRGALTAIVGPNGSGKTTLLRALTGDLPYGGSVRLNDLDVATAKPWQLAAQRAVLAQAVSLAFPFTVQEVVQLGVAAGIAAGRNDLPDLALQRVGLQGYQARLYQELSGGEQARVQLARVLTQVWEPVLDGAPRWLFLDEPVSALDIGHQLQVMRLARGFADAGGGVVAVMHDLNLTSMFSDSVALMSNGRLVEQGAPEIVLRDDLLSEAYGCALRVNTPPTAGPYILPQAAFAG